MTCVKTENDKKEGDAAEEDDEKVEEEEEEFSDNGDYDQVEKCPSAILNNSTSINIVYILLVHDWLFRKWSNFYHTLLSRKQIELYNAKWKPNSSAVSADKLTVQMNIILNLKIL